MSHNVYFDTSVWLAPYDEWRDQTTGEDVGKIIEAHKNRKIRLYTSRQIVKELQELLNNPEKSVKAQKALAVLTSLDLSSLPFTPAIFGKAVFGEMIFGQEQKFSDILLRDPDKEVAEFMTANNIDFFVSVDSDFLKIKSDIETRLRRENTSVMTPDELCRVLYL